MNSNNKFSRYLSALLRHRALDQGYAIDSRGFVSVDQIIKKCNNITPCGIDLARTKVTYDTIKQIVDSNDKKRFELEEHDDGWYIRAVQGHSMPGINPDLVLINDPSEIPIVVHGTYYKAYELIKNTGLNRMGRTHIHFAHGTPADESVISGMRKTSQVMIFIDVPKAMANGIKFYKSSNGVILSDGINGVIQTEYFLRVELAE